MVGQTGRAEVTSGSASVARRTVVRSAARAVAVAGLAAAAAARSQAGLAQLESEFRAAIERAEGATVVVVPRAAGRGQVGTSGVVVSKTGLVLTSDEAGRIVGAVDAAGAPQRTDDVEVRIPDLRTGTFTNHRGRVVGRLADLGSALVRIVEPPRGGFPACLAPGTSAHVDVGRFTFAVGNSFGLASESPPTLTAGIVAGVTRLPPNDRSGAFEWIYTSAAVNPGVGGGPLVDVHGRLVGIVDGWVDAAAEPECPFQFLGRVTPIDRLRAGWSGHPDGAEAFSAPPPPLRADEADALETVLGRVAAAGHPSLVGLVVERAHPLSGATVGPGGAAVELPRYRGAVTGVVASDDGLVVTSLHNLTNVATIVSPAAAQALPKDGTARAGLDAVRSITAHLSDGTAAPAQLVGVHEPLGIAVLRIQVPGLRRLRVPDAAPPEELEEGRFVLALGSPFGAAPTGSPLATFGILSKFHAEDDPNPWRGHWQTDARATDANCGGAVVDLRGRILGVLALWNVAQHGRASGVAFVLPWAKVRDVLPELAAGRSFRRPFLGVQWSVGGVGAQIQSVLEGSAAQAAGLVSGDVIRSLDGAPVANIGDCVRLLSRRRAGDRVKVVVRRGAADVEVEAVLGARD